MGLCFGFCEKCCLSDVEQHPRCPQAYLDALKGTALRPMEIEYLFRRFCFIGQDSITYPPQHLKKYQFLSIGRLQQNPVLSILLNSMFGDRKVLKFVDFAKYIAIYRVNNLSAKQDEIDNARERKMRLLFDMYDHDRNGIITKEDLLKIVHKLYSQIMSTKQILNIVNASIEEMDTTLTQQVMYADFCNALNAFDMDGKCIIQLPTL